MQYTHFGRHLKMFGSRYPTIPYYISAVSRAYTESIPNALCSKICVQCSKLNLKKPRARSLVVSLFLAFSQDRLQYPDEQRIIIIVMNLYFGDFFILIVVCITFFINNETTRCIR